MNTGSVNKGARSSAWNHDRWCSGVPGRAYDAQKRAWRHATRAMQATRGAAKQTSQQSSTVDVAAAAVVAHQRQCSCHRCQRFCCRLCRVAMSCRCIVSSLTLLSRLWNALPVYLKNTCSISKVLFKKKKLKERLLQSLE